MGLQGSEEAPTKASEPWASGGVQVDLSQRSAYAYERLPSGERLFIDTLAGIEGASTGPGSDTLIGDGGPNRLEGEAGNDFVRAAGGDVIAAGDGSDTLQMTVPSGE